MPHLIPAPRPVPTREDRMTDARTDRTSPRIQAARVDGFNVVHPVGTPVRYWKGAREGDGKVSRTRTEAQLLSGHTAVVWLENVSGCIALTHVQPITEEEFTAAPAEQWPTAATGRSFRTWMSATERDQLDARAATAEQERDDALDDRDNARAERDVYKAQVANLREQLDRANAGRQQLEEQLDGMVEHRDRLLRVAQGQAPKVRAAGQLAAIVREANELIARALAGWDTTPGEPEPGAVTITLDNSSGTFTPSSASAPGSPRRGRGEIEQAIRERLADAWPYLAADPVHLEQIAVQATIAALDATP